MLTIRAMSDGASYSARHLQHSDYFAEGERVIGKWVGRGAAMLGLQGAVRDQEFEALRQGLDPRTGEFIRQRQGSDRIGADGATQSQARHLYDFTFSAPKSVSIMAILADDQRLREAHTRAVAVALAELEDHACARVRQGGANTDRRTSNIALAVYEHDTSRELDQDLREVGKDMPVTRLVGVGQSRSATPCYGFRDGRVCQSLMLVAAGEGAILAGQRGPRRQF